MANNLLHARIWRETSPGGELNPALYDARNALVIISHIIEERGLTDEFYARIGEIAGSLPQIKKIVMDDLRTFDD